MSWIKVAPIDKIDEGFPVIVDFEYETAAIFRVGAQFFAIEDRCSHDDGPLADGMLDGFEAICPRHGARIDIRTGEAVTPPAYGQVPIYETKVEDGVLFVKSAES